MDAKIFDGDKIDDDKLWLVALKYEISTKWNQDNPICMLKTWKKW